MLVPGHETLDAFELEPGCGHGVFLRDLEPGTVLTVHTRNTRYQMVVTDAAENRVLISGGDRFPARTEVQIKGATTGGSAIKLGWIGTGLRLEIADGPRRITTSRVQSVMVQEFPDASLRLTA